MLTKVRRWPLRGGRGSFILLFGALLMLATVHLGAQPTQAQETTNLEAVTKWKIINTALFAAFLGFLIWKYAPAFFNARSLSIRKAIEEATGLKIEAEFRYSEIDRKMATLSDEIRKLQAQEEAERERDHQRFRQETEASIAHIWHNAQAEIEGQRLEGIRRARQLAANHALQFAEQRIRERQGGNEPQEFVDDFIHLVGRGKAG